MTGPNRAHFKDVPKTILLTSELLEWSLWRSDVLDLSYSAYIRKLIAEDRERLEKELKQQEDESTSPNPDHILTSLIGLLKEYPDLPGLLAKLRNGKE
jgi:hypothetical protein